MIKTDASVRHIIIRLFGIRDVCLFLFKYFRNTLFALAALMVIITKIMANIIRFIRIVIQ